MPALVRVLHNGNPGLGFHINDVSRAGCFTCPAAAAQLLIDNRSQLPLPRFSKLDGRLGRSLALPEPLPPRPSPSRSQPEGPCPFSLGRPFPGLAALDKPDVRSSGLECRPEAELGAAALLRLDHDPVPLFPGLREITPEVGKPEPALLPDECAPGDHL